MKKSILTFLILLIAITSYCQTKEQSSKLNFDFETIEKGRATGWNDFGSSSYIVALDSNHVKSGKYSASVEFKEGKPDYKVWVFVIPDSYSGKKIKLTGYIKTENVTDGYAGLLMNIDPSTAFDNMKRNRVKGTTDWKKYEITLDINPEKTQEIIVGGLLDLL